MARREELLNAILENKSAYIVTKNSRGYVEKMDDFALVRAGRQYLYFNNRPKYKHLEIKINKDNLGDYRNLFNSFQHHVYISKEDAEQQIQYAANRRQLWSFFNTDIGKPIQHLNNDQVKAIAEIIGIPLPFDEGNKKEGA